MKITINVPNFDDYDEGSFDKELKDANCTPQKFTPKEVAEWIKFELGIINQLPKCDCTIHEGALRILMDEATVEYSDY